MNMPNLGWIPFDERTRDQREASELALKGMPKFAFTSGATPPVGTKIMLTDVWSHANIVSFLGKPYTGTRQVSGSCVWAGVQNVMCIRAWNDVLRVGDFEKILFPNCLPNYGRSRFRAGMRGRGEGSMGATMAASCSEDGTPDTLFQGLPQPISTDNQWCWGSDAEMAWSDGERIASSVLAEAKKHRTITTELKSADAVRDMILASNPCTTAYGMFVDIGSAVVRDGVLIGKINKRGGHQTSWLNYWHHPTQGELFWKQNQWGLAAYGNDPGGGPLGGHWETRDSVQRQCSDGDGEVYAFLDYTGTIPDTFSWLV